MNTRLLAGTWLLLTLATSQAHAAETVLDGARQEYVTRMWGKGDGLPDAPVTALLQARDGYLWVGTGVGLFRFDGDKFTEVAIRTPATVGPISITALTEDAHVRLWIGTEQDGLFCREGASLQHYGKAEGLLDEEVTSLSIDKEDRLWIGTRQGVNRRSGDGFAQYKVKDGLPDDFVSNVHAARSGAIWITTRRGMCSWARDHLAPFQFAVPGQGRIPEFLGTYEDLQGHLWAFGATYLINLNDGRRFNYFHEDQPASMRIWSLCEGRDGRLWIGTSGGGLFCFEGGKFQPVTLGEARSLNDIRAICEDNEGNLWLGVSEGGLTRLRRQLIETFNGNKGLPPGAATCVGLDAFGRINVGLERGGVFVEINHRFEKLPDPSGVTSRESVTCLSPALDGSLWVGTAGSGLCQVKDGKTGRWTMANGLSDDFISTLGRGRDGTIWVGGRFGALLRLSQGELVGVTNTDGLLENAARTVLATSDGGILIGTDNGEVLRAREGSIYTVKTSSSLGGKPILSLYEGSSGRLWIGTAGRGLGCLVGRRCLVWNTRDFLPDDVISGIVEDGGANLWLVTRRGICRVSSVALAQGLQTGQAPRAKLIFETQTAISREVFSGGPRALRAPNGRLWFATDEGPVSLDPQDWLSEEPPPPVRIERVLVNNVSLGTPSLQAIGPSTKESDAVTLANLRTLEIQFTALSFTAPEKINFRHRLENFDADWVESGPERRVHYGSLPGGRYNFQVTARHGEGPWSPAGARFSFVVPVPWWRTPAALLSYASILTLMIIGMVRVVSHRRLRRRLARVEQQQVMERERVRIAQDMHDEIGSKLTKISFLSELAKGEMGAAGPAAAKVNSISETSRELLQSLDEIVWAVNPRNDTLEHLAEYLAQYATEYFQNTSVECDLRLPSQLPKQSMSAETRHNIFLAFEECLNNALKHSGATRVQVQIMSDQDQFQVLVKDNGHGFPTTTPDGISRRVGPGVGGGNGLINMRERLAEVGGQCEITSVPNLGTTVILSLALTSLKVHA